MSEKPAANLAELMVYIRNEFLAARAADDKLTLEYLGHTLDVMVEFAYKTENRPFAGIIEDLKYGVNDYLVGAQFKSSIPSEETIRQVFTKN